MKFEEVLPLLREGKHVRRAIWSLKNKSMTYPPGFGGFNLWLGNKPHGTLPQLTGQAIMAEDWEEFNPEGGK